MAEEKVYLELSEENGVSHKFYEVTVDDTEVKIRYGRIGTRGRTQTKTYSTAEQAKIEAEKKIKGKIRKGYEHAVMGVRKKRPITRRPTASRKSTAKQAPILWKFASGRAAFGIFIDADRCWVGNQNGKVFALSHHGEVLFQFQLSEGVKCLVVDDVWIYAGCDDGNVYDLSGKLPRAVYEIAEDVDIYWLDIWDGILGVSDADGGITAISPEEELMWARKSAGKHGWMVRCDPSGVYHGHSGGVTMCDLETGVPGWHLNTDGAVLFGWQIGDYVYAGTAHNKVHCFTKQGVEVGAACRCDAPVYSCAATVDGEYVFAGDNSSSVYCFDRAGQRLWKLATGCGSALSMQFFNDCVYIVTTDGALACIDASEEAIKAAQQGEVPKPVDIKAPEGEAPRPTTELETTSDTSGGVILQCIKEGGKLRVRVVSPGYDSNWNVQFPRNLRTEGARYVVDEVRESARGGFYRAYGDIKRLV